jgi:hypothetical protein
MNLISIVSCFVWWTAVSGGTHVHAGCCKLHRWNMLLAASVHMDESSVTSYSRTLGVFSFYHRLSTHTFTTNPHYQDFVMYCHVTQIIMCRLNKSDIHTTFYWINVAIFHCMYIHKVALQGWQILFSMSYLIVIKLKFLFSFFREAMHLSNRAYTKISKKNDTYVRNVSRFGGFPWLRKWDV